LIDHAPGRAVLQFNDVDLRLPWLRARFPEADILHVYRHPRDQWCSTLPRGEFDMTALQLRAFEKYDGFYPPRKPRLPRTKAAAAGGALRQMAA